MAGGTGLLSGSRERLIRKEQLSKGRRSRQYLGGRSGLNHRFAGGRVASGYGHANEGQIGRWAGQARRAQRGMPEDTRPQVGEVNDNDNQYHFPPVHHFLGQKARAQGTAQRFETAPRSGMRRGPEWSMSRAGHTRVEPLCRETRLQESVSQAGPQPGCLCARRTEGSLFDLLVPGAPATSLHGEGRRDSRVSVMAVELHPIRDCSAQLSFLICSAR